MAFNKQKSRGDKNLPGLFIDYLRKVSEISQYYYAALRRRATPTRPNRPEPNNQTAAGTGTGATTP